MSSGLNPHQFGQSDAYGIFICSVCKVRTFFFAHDSTTPRYICNSLPMTSCPDTCEEFEILKLLEDVDLNSNSRSFGSTGATGPTGPIGYTGSINSGVFSKL